MLTYLVALLGLLLRQSRPHILDDTLSLASHTLQLHHPAFVIQT